MGESPLKELTAALHREGYSELEYHHPGDEDPSISGNVQDVELAESEPPVHESDSGQLVPAEIQQLCRRYGREPVVIGGDVGTNRLHLYIA
jgi:hypothetical protein